MMRALFSGVTGLRSHQTKMDVIGNNISNVNTLGFKKSAANFADLYSETTSSATAPSGNKGGTNASQVGLGVSVNAIVVKHTPGAASYTGNTLDLAIAGDGYFTVRVGAEGDVRYTRAGNFSVSSNGSLVTAAGYFVQCFNTMYTSGTQGEIMSTVGCSDASTTGFNSFSFNEDASAIATASTGTYTMQLNQNNRVDVYKNGVLFAENLDIQARSSKDTWETIGASISPNTDYRVTIPGLGTVNFRSDGHSLSAAGLKNKTYGSLQNSNYVSTTTAENLQKYLPTGTYTIGAVEEGEPATIIINDLSPDIVSQFTDTVDVLALDVPGETSYRIKRNPVPRDADPNDKETKFVYTLQSKPKTTGTGGDDDDPKVPTDVDVPAGSVIVGGGGNPVDGGQVADPDKDGYRDVILYLSGGGITANQQTLLPSTTYTLTTPLGNIQFTTQSGSNVKNPAFNLSYDKDYNKPENYDDTSYGELLNGALFTVTAPKTEGAGDNYTTGMLYVDTLLRGASINVQNNDGFSSGATMNDMIINQDLFQEIQITEDGAVVGTLKKAASAAELREQGIVGAVDMAAGERVILGYVAMANFSNAEGLEKIGTNLYQATTNSGRPMYGLAGDGGVGSLTSNSLEMSNVDLSEEMVNMITTQRGFQANSRIITVTDTMLEELINLKR